MALTGAAKTAYQREYMRRRRARLASTKQEKPDLTTKAGQRAAIERSPVAKSVTAHVVQSAREIFAVMTSEQRFGLATYCTSQLTKTQLNAFAHWFNDILTRGWKEET
jgi:hypothetical protein